MAYKTLPPAPQSRSCLRAAFHLALTLLAASVTYDFMAPLLMQRHGGRARDSEDPQLPRFPTTTIHLPVPRPKPGVSHTPQRRGKWQSRSARESGRKGVGEGGGAVRGSLLRRGVERGSLLWKVAAAAGAKPLLQGLDSWEVLSRNIRSFLGMKRQFKFEEWPTVACTPGSLQEVASNLSALHHSYWRGDPAVVFAHPIPKVIHQTHGKKLGSFELASIAAWTNMHANYEHVVWSDASARAFLARCVPEALPLYDAAPAAILRSDMLRYLLLLVFGGIWGDADTQPLRVYHNWLEGVRGTPSLGNVRLIAGVEEDAGDWERKRFVRPIQIVQWAMAASPGHPAVRHVVQQMLRGVVSLVQDVYSLGSNSTGPHKHKSQVTGPHRSQITGPHNSQVTDLPSSQSQVTNGSSGFGGLWAHLGRKGLLQGHSGPREKNDKEEEFSIGPIGPFKLPPPGGAAPRRNITKKDILQSTGPGAWTDGIAWGLEKAGATMGDLVKMRTGKAFGDMVILPITAFSPGVGQGQSERSPEARVKHWFTGSWKAGVKDE